MKKIIFLFCICIIILNSANAQAPSFRLASAISVTANPIPQGTYVTVAATFQNNSSTAGTFDFECDLETSSGTFRTVLGKQCGIYVAGSSTVSLTFSRNSGGATDVNPVNFAPGSYRVRMIVSANGGACVPACGTKPSSCISQVASGNFTNPLPVTVTSAYCGGTTNLTTCSGSFDDGSGSSNYGNQYNCSWLIQPSGASSVTLSFSSFSTESGYDFVKVYNGTNSSAPLLGSFSGSSIPSPVTSGSSMFVQFTSDNATVAQGWSANYTCTSSCTAPTSSFTVSSSNITQGGSVTTSNNSTGSPTPTYSWSASPSGGVSFSPSSSATNPTITFANTGTYMVSLTATNSCNPNSNSFTRTVTVTQGCTAATVSSPSSTFVSPGNTATFTVTANGTTPITYQWQVNTGGNWSNLSNSGNTTWTNTGTSSELSIANTTAGMSGYLYRCVVSNNCSSNVNSSAGTLTVTQGCTPVSINTQPQSRSATVGGTATFTVSTSGTAPFTYQWRKNGSNISGATNPSYITPVLTLSDNGNTYSCYITNCNGLHNATSNSATLTVTTSQNGVISGTVIAPDISDLSGMVVNNTVNATVKIFNSGSSTPINTTTAIGGNFSFNSLATGNYDIEASIISGSVTYKTTKTNIQSGTSNISVKLSSNVIEQIAGFNTQLSNLNCYLEDLGQTIPSSVSYNMSSSYNYINNKRVLTNSYESDIEALLRLAMAERLLVKYYGQARTMSQEFVKSADEFAKATFDLVEMVSCTPTPNLILKELSNSIIDCVSAGVKLWMGVSYGKIYFEAAIDGTVDGLKAQGIPLYSIYNTQRNWIHPLYLSGSLKNNYIKPTLSLPNAYVSKSQNYDFTGSLQNTVNSNNSLLYSSENNTAYAQGYADGLRNSPMWIEFLYDLSPNFSCVNPYVRITSVGLKVIEITFLGMSISKSVKRSIQLTNEVHPNAVNSYYKTDGIQNSIFNKSLHDSRSINAANAVDNFEAEYFNTINELSAGNYSNLTAHITSLVALNKELNEIVNDETQAIKSALYFLSMEDSVIVSSLQNTIISSPLQRAGLLLALTYLNENQSEQQLKDSILAYSNLIYTFNALMLNELNVLANSVSGAQSPPYISVKQSNIPLVAYPSTGVPIVLKVKNHGSTNASNVYLKLEIAPLATFSTDSIYIGSLLADEEKDVSFTLYSSTIEDSLSFYTISIHGDSILSNGKGGATLSRKNIISNVSTIDKRDKTLTIYPNPNNGVFRVTTEITTEKISYLKLYSSLGQLVYSKEIMPAGNSFDETISTTNLPKGIYTLQMNIDGKLQSKKMIIQ